MSVPFIVSFDTYREGKVVSYIGILDEVPSFSCPVAGLIGRYLAWYVSVF